MNKPCGKSGSVEAAQEKTVPQPVQKTSEKPDGKIKPEGRIKHSPLPPPRYKPIN